MNEPIRMFIADDNRLLREGLASMLAQQQDIIVIGAAASGSKALEQIKDLRPEVALIDIGMPDKDGIPVWVGHFLTVPSGRFYAVLKSGDDWRVTAEWQGETSLMLRAGGAGDGL